MKIKTLFLQRPKTVLQQYIDAIQGDYDFILVLDEDSKLESLTNYFLDSSRTLEFVDKFDFIPFRWTNAPKIFGRKTFGIGIYRVSALRSLPLSSYTSEGLDLILASQLRTSYETFLSYEHSAKLSFAAFYRYGKGRAYANKILHRKSFPIVKLYRQYWKLYLAWIMGYAYGSLTKPKDSNW